ncbi:hypothetical protein EXIGLDRAFT_783867 [Exidia glandulosa HHB12029]|uniref:Uncharacterized protein n=1 Tax=Exidia glandulosa HHB12029 TaxID=1314781 RepID=A0A166MUH9_EXIGL|nr:hypothetical protein EXIGLDRAFT_783867 [Exidia glandulosa HHB12029]
MSSSRPPVLVPRVLVLTTRHSLKSTASRPTRASPRSASTAVGFASPSRVSGYRPLFLRQPAPEICKLHVSRPPLQTGAYLKLFDGRARQISCPYLSSFALRDFDFYRPTPTHPHRLVISTHNFAFLIRNASEPRTRSLVRVPPPVGPARPQTLRPIHIFPALQADLDEYQLRLREDSSAHLPSFALREWGRIWGFQTRACQVSSAQLDAFDLRSNSSHATFCATSSEPAPTSRADSVTYQKRTRQVWNPHLPALALRELGAVPTSDGEDVYTKYEARP